MKIVPSSPYQTNSKAELRVFDKLRESFVGNNKYLSFHSLNLTKHKTKKFGEADFVIVCEYGVFVIEVKGGRIGVNDGNWCSINRHGEKFSIHDPFRQAEGALHSIKNEIQGSNLFRNMRIPIGYGVIFPDVEWTANGAEWDLRTICDSKRLRNFESWLRNFFSYWQSKPGNNIKLSVEEIKSLAKYLRPNFELVEPLYSKISNIEKTTVTLTEEQYRYLDIVLANKKVLCAGGAGTGKTFLAAELARRMANQDTNVVLMCKSKWLKRYLETRIVNEFVTISTIESVRVDMRRAGVDSYDILIVDEGQDLFDFNDMDILESILDGGLANGEWYIFHDVNNQHGLFGETKLETLELLESYNPAKIPLVNNCRNSKQIVTKVHEYLQLDMGTSGTGNGPEVHVLTEKAGCATTLEHEIHTILSSGVTSSSITILSPTEYEKSSVSLLPDKLKKMIHKLDDYSVRSFPPSEISFSEIKNFKGLENEVIIVVDLTNPKKLGDESKVEHYVAMSRAKALLSVIWSA